MTAKEMQSETQGVTTEEPVVQVDKPLATQNGSNGSSSVKKARGVLLQKRKKSKKAAKKNQKAKRG